MSVLLGTANFFLVLAFAAPHYGIGSVLGLLCAIISTFTLNLGQPPREKRPQMSIAEALWLDVLWARVVKAFRPRRRKKKRSSAQKAGRAFAEKRATR